MAHDNLAPHETGRRPQGREYYSPRADVFEDSDCVRVLLEMPGVSASGLEVNLEKSLLVIEGTIGEESPPGMSRLHREYGEGSYRRSFTISDAINRDKIAVTIKSGVVEVILPKNEEVKPRKIAVRAA